MKTIDERDLACVAGGADQGGWKTYPNSAIRSQKNPSGGVTVDWYKAPHNSTRSPLDGTYKVKLPNGQTQERAIA